ncbi:hypothetical protein [Streptomyces sp. NPDC059215]|uniref:hypothetical protein n=1 Tax=Streptomyces sp. NPDC059215 TaxID=3346772 RepID=UPI003679EC25
MNADQVPEQGGGPVETGRSEWEPKNSMHEAEEQPVWGEALPWLEEIGPYEPSTSHGSGPTESDFHEESESWTQGHMAEGSAKFDYAQEASFPPNGNEDNSRRESEINTATTGMQSQGEFEEQLVVVDSSSIGNSPTDRLESHERDGRRPRLRRRIAIPAVLAGMGLVTMSAMVITHHDTKAETHQASPPPATVADSVASTTKQDTNDHLSGGATSKHSAHASPSITNPSDPPTEPSSSSTPSMGPTDAPTSEPHVPSQTHSITANPTETPTASQAPHIIYATAVLNPGNAVTWGKGTLAMTARGNLVVIDEKGITRWASHTTGSDLQTVFQNDGCLAIYNPDGTVAWSSYTNGHPEAVLVMTADGNVEIRLGNTTLWQTGTGH